MIVSRQEGSERPSAAVMTQRLIGRRLSNVRTGQGWRVSVALPRPRRCGQETVVHRSPGPSGWFAGPPGFMLDQTAITRGPGDPALAWRKAALAAALAAALRTEARRCAVWA